VQWSYLIGGLGALCIFCYLLYALIRAERF